MIYHTLNILAALDNRTIIRIIEGKTLEEYTSQRHQRDGEMLAALLITVLPVDTFLVAAGIIAAQFEVVKKQIELKGGIG